MKAAALAAALTGILVALLAARFFRKLGHKAPSILRRTESDLAQMFIFISAGRLRRITAITLTLLGAAGAGAGLSGMAILVLLALTAFLPRLLVEALRKRWRRRVTAQLPDALALWAALLRAGQGMASALVQLASRQADPLGAELRLVLSHYRLGVSVDGAMERLRDRTSIPDLRMLSTLLRAQREMGGNLAESLERLASLLRARLAMEARIHSLTAQGRLQGVIVGALPLLLALALAFIEPEAMSSMLGTPAGIAAVLLVATLELLGFVLIRRIVKIDV